MSTIHFSPFTSIFENGPAGTVITGTSGTGKTFFTTNLAANALMYNQRVFAMDMKNDLLVLKNIDPSIQIIDINNISPGSLNPFIVFDSVDVPTIISIISIITGGLTSKQKTTITPIVDDFVKQFERTNANISFSTIADYLYANEAEEAQNIGTALKIHERSEYGQLLFGEYKKEKMTKDDIGLASLDSKVISLFGMDLPKSDENISESQLFNSAIVFIICKMMRDILKNGDRYPTLFVLDEAHIAFNNPSFMQMIDDFLKIGRSLNIAILLATQNASHIPDSIVSLIASKFTFKMSKREAELFVEKFGNESNSDNTINSNKVVNIITNSKLGECFFIDWHNRSGAFKVTSQFGNDMSTNPLMAKRSKNVNKN